MLSVLLPGQPYTVGMERDTPLFVESTQRLLENLLAHTKGSIDRLGRLYRSGELPGIRLQLIDDLFSQSVQPAFC